MCSLSSQIKKISAEKRLDQLPQLSVPMLLPVPQVFNATAPYGNDFRETQGRSTSADTYGELLVFIGCAVESSCEVDGRDWPDILSCVIAKT